ncbi:MAG: phosphatidate cytidylyltransferase [Flavipsychrobacter sp.]|nr:phosphatidate cytidylyltransferase [Flavipsychrobacter sp.]
MKKVTIFGLLAILVSLSSCELIGDIFEAGVWVGVMLVVGVVAVVFFLLAKVFGRR